jgi:DNA topoisomerase-3
MNIAETLYMDGFISYPRTETDQFPKGFDFKQHIEHQAGHQLWGEYAQRLLGGGFRMPKAGKNNDQSHPPIYPVRAAPNLQGHAKQLYEFIVRHYLACCSDDAKGAETKVRKMPIAIFLPNIRALALTRLFDVA